MPSKPTTLVLKEHTQLVVPASIRRKAGIKRGDCLGFEASPKSITITAVERTYNPTKAEWAAIRKGEAEIARGEYVSLSEFLDGLDGRSRKVGRKGSRKVSR